VRALVASGTSVLLTTQYLDEADQLADRIAVIDNGSVIAEGTSGELKASTGRGALHVRVGNPQRRADARRLLTQVLGAQVRLEADPSALSASVSDSGHVAHALAELSRAGIAVSEFALGQPSLDEVFLALTGRPSTDPATEEEAA
jgi:ABC-2 type transport system ATP-binding protein